MIRIFSSQLWGSGFDSVEAPWGCSIKRACLDQSSIIIYVQGTHQCHHPYKVGVQAPPSCSHCLWCLVTSQTPLPVPLQVGHDHLYMLGEQHHDHPASVWHKLWHSGEWDREQANSSHHQPHSGQLCLLWAVHGQSLDGPTYRPAGSSPGHSEGWLVVMTLVVMTLVVMTLVVMTLVVMTLVVMTLVVMTLCFCTRVYPCAETQATQNTFEG